MPRFRSLATIALLLAPFPVLASGLKESGPPLQVLFLGDKGHHRPADRAAQLGPVMHDRGIEVTYTERLDDLNPATLARYDALIVYANIDEIAPSQEQSLLGYVASGGGFVPLHCASHCFRNSPAYVALVGAQFQRHGTGEFETKVVDANHPITVGLEPFRTWDETYVHTKHNEKDRHVLQVRAEGTGDEPWTWVRTHGKGRVFYTAYGHDGRTWGVTAFHDLIERGIRWAAHQGDVADHHPRPRAGLKPFDFGPAGDKIPNYTAGAKWGTQGETIARMQRPLAAEESVKHMVMPKGFEARLFAAEPDIAKPLCMAWDQRGRLWIAESTDYPNNLKKVGAGDDRIKICEDTDGDGRADKFTIFADKLSIPTSIAFSNGGIIVQDAPDTLFLKDTDGDDKADVRTVLFTGWGTRDTHAGPSNLRQGFDNWIWGMVGYSGFEGVVGGERLRFSQGFYRFKPDGSKLEFLRSTNNNTWGLGFTEDGLIFGSTANNCPSVYLPVPNRYYESVRGFSPSVLQSIAGWNRFFPATENVRQVDWHGGFTAAAGHAIYTARAYPKWYWNRTAFITEPTGHLAATFLLEPNGSDFASNNTWNLVASDDEWTSPIAAEVGPDGHVWIIDWYNYIVQHNPTPQGFQTGKGNAYVTSLRDKTHGRVYRIVYTDAKVSKPLALDPDDGKGLVAALKNDNLFWRLHAQRLLVERGKKDVVPDLVKLGSDMSSDENGLNTAAIHSLWALRGLGPDVGSADIATLLLQSESASVRRNAIEALPASQAAQAVGAATRDPDPRVRLAGLLKLSEAKSNAAVGRELASQLGPAGRFTWDRWLSDAATVAASSHAGPFLGAAAEPVRGKPGVEFLQITSRVAEHFARGGPGDSIGGLLVKLQGAEPPIADAIVAGLVKGWPKDKTATLTAEEDKALVASLSKVSKGARGPLVSLAARWGSKALETYSGEIISSLLATVRDESKSDDARAAAAGQLVEFRPDDPGSAVGLLALITPRTAPALASGLVAAVARTRAPGVAPILVKGLTALTPSVRSQAVRALIGREDWAPVFLDGVEKGTLRFDELSLDQKQALASHPIKTIAERARKLLAQGGGLPDLDRQKVIDALAPVVLKAGDAAKGKLVFEQQCSKCHSHSGKGGQVGPDLTGMAAHPKAELLVNILDPSRSVEGNFVSYTVATADGRTYNGLLASETKTAVELIDTEGKTVKLLRDEIEELVASKKSLMPEGFEKQVPAESIADLLAFLTQRGKYLPLDLRKVATIASDRGMFYDKEGTVERMIFADWSPKLFEGVPFVLIDPKAGTVPNVVLLHSINGTVPPTMPRSVSLPCALPVKALHFLSGVSGWGWNGGPNARPTTSLIVRLHYLDGATEDHALKNGVEFADYVRHIDVPGSKPAFDLQGRQIRYLSVQPNRSAPLARVELVKGPDTSAPIVMAVTAELIE